MRLLIAITALFTAIAGAVLARDAGIADACAGLIGSNGAVNLGRTTTLAGYHDGVEHYVTAFQFQGGGGQFGTLIPLPGVPTNVERGGAWTLQRLQLETQRFRALNADAPHDPARQPVGAAAHPRPRQAVAGPHRCRRVLAYGLEAGAAAGACG